MVRAPGVTAEPSGDRTVVLDAEATTMSTLNPVGALLFAQLVTPHTAAQLVEVLRRQFPDVPVTTLESDVDSFLAQMRSAGLIVPADADG
ncbi:PqqD family protein [Euzebya tangerina]|uniref:PqqD family protein n=1 Tax=Euzebya tangerina TaxID=591198 RepID=UPI0013C36770|nr:PqqD family protein [Euzebya tangerina]